MSADTAWQTCRPYTCSATCERRLWKTPPQPQNSELMSGLDCYHTSKQSDVSAALTAIRSISQSGSRPQSTAGFRNRVLFPLAFYGFFRDRSQVAVYLIESSPRTGVLRAPSPRSRFLNRSNAMNAMSSNVGSFGLFSASRRRSSSSAIGSSSRSVLEDHFFVLCAHQTGTCQGKIQSPILALAVVLDPIEPATSVLRLLEKEPATVLNNDTKRGIYYLRC